MAPISDSTVARIAGNILGGLRSSKDYQERISVSSQLDRIENEMVAEAVRLARMIVAEVEVHNTSDLKLVDELLCDLKSQLKCNWVDLETWSQASHEAMARLRIHRHNMPLITLSLSKYFEE